MPISYPDRYTHFIEMMKRLGVEAPGVMAGFGQMHGAGVADGVLSSKTKELIALSIGIAVRCDGCVAFHVHDALGAGATRAEIVETIGVAVVMGGGPSVVYGCEALEAVQQFEDLATSKSTDG